MKNIKAIFIVFVLIIGQTAFTPAKLLKTKRESVTAFAGVNVISQGSDHNKFYNNSIYDLNGDLQTLVETEKAFAATAVKEGFRDSFIKFFDDDGIGFGPEPQKTKGILQKTPPRTTPAPTVFNWQPVYGDIAAAGDFGYTTGPVLYTDRNTPAKVLGHGLYFSVWKKQSGGDWKVILDMGVDVPQAVAPIDTAFTPAPAPKILRKELEMGNFNTLDEEFSADIEKKGLIKAYTERINNEFRIHRSGIMPILDKDTLDKFLKSQPAQLSFKSLGGNISASKDFAYTYGSFQTDGEKANQKGYYVHVWRRDSSKKWRLAADIVN